MRHRNWFTESLPGIGQETSALAFFRGSRREFLGRRAESFPRGRKAGLPVTHCAMANVYWATRDVRRRPGRRASLSLGGRKMDNDLANSTKRHAAIQFCCVGARNFSSIHANVFAHISGV